LQVRLLPGLPKQGKLGSLSVHGAMAHQRYDPDVVEIIVSRLIYLHVVAAFYARYPQVGFPQLFRIYWRGSC
jgi:hypothetical protein